ncbi:MAG: hypothetical protein JWQ76_3874 [Ramlibacter sp.]|nr:hypothetical protein [Ramlibacter sp.]
MRQQQHLAFWFVLAVLAFFAGPLVRSGPELERDVRLEIEQTRGAVGELLGARMLEFAYVLYTRTPVAAATGQLARAKHTPAEQRLSNKVAGPGGALASALFNSYLQGLILQAYVLTLRLAIVTVWLLAVAPLLLAAVYDGLMQRAVKQAEFGALRPATFTLAGMLVIPMLSLPLLYLTWPWHLSPLLAPAWAALVALPLSLLVANSQPLFGR